MTFSCSTRLASARPAISPQDTPGLASNMSLHHTAPVVQQYKRMLTVMMDLCCAGTLPQLSLRCPPETSPDWRPHCHCMGQLQYGAARDMAEMILSCSAYSVSPRSQLS